MRDRHLPRLCRECDAPLARQSDHCWRCDAAIDDAERDTGPGHPADDTATHDASPEPRVPVAA